MSNGIITLGVDEQGQLNVPGPPSANGYDRVGLRYTRDGQDFEATAAGCLCEGWGGSFRRTNNGQTYSGSANNDDGVRDLITFPMISDGINATTVATLTDLNVTHHFFPSPDTPNLYQVRVTYENVGRRILDQIRYRRVMNWDIPPTVYNECVTIDVGNSASLEYASDNGFLLADPTVPDYDPDRYDGAPTFACPDGEGCPVYDSGPEDHGALFQFLFKEDDGETPLTLYPGDRFSFDIFYGAAGNKADAAGALEAVGAEVFSFGYPPMDVGCNAENTGAPNTFIFAFRGVGGDPVTIATEEPSAAPSVDISLLSPSQPPSGFPSTVASNAPTLNLSESPSETPSVKPSQVPSTAPSLYPAQVVSNRPSLEPSTAPSVEESNVPTLTPSDLPTAIPSEGPSGFPSTVESYAPTLSLSNSPSEKPSVKPSQVPSTAPSLYPSQVVSNRPSVARSLAPSVQESNVPTLTPSDLPTANPSVGPSCFPSTVESYAPTLSLSNSPSETPSEKPSQVPSTAPSLYPSQVVSNRPSVARSLAPSVEESNVPTLTPSDLPTANPSEGPSTAPTLLPSQSPSSVPSTVASNTPTLSQSYYPSVLPSVYPSQLPSNEPSFHPSQVDSNTPSLAPSTAPSVKIADAPTLTPSTFPSVMASISPSTTPSLVPSSAPTASRSASPSASHEPSYSPSAVATAEPTRTQSYEPSAVPSSTPSLSASQVPTSATFFSPSAAPTSRPTALPTAVPTSSPTIRPSFPPTPVPTSSPTALPTTHPTSEPTMEPTADPTSVPTSHPTSYPTVTPTHSPTEEPTPATIRVTGVKLVNSVTLDEFPVNDGDTFNTADVGEDLTLVADTSGPVQSVVFDLDGAPAVQTENVIPYALNGDIEGDFFKVAEFVRNRRFVVKATPFSEPDAMGYEGESLEVEFGLIDYCGIEGVVLIDPATDLDLISVEDGMLIPEDLLEGVLTLTLRVDYCGTVESVVFDFDGVENYNIENFAPFSLGDDNEGDYQEVPGLIRSGEHTVSFQPYSEDEGAGFALAEKATVRLTLP